MSAPSPPKFSDGEAYEKMMGRWSRMAGEKFLDWLTPPSGLRWLDVGCGNGAFTELLVDRTSPKFVEGIDPSEGLLARANQRIHRNKANFSIGDAASLPYQENQFDAAVMALVINFLPEPLKAVKEMIRVVKSGGMISTYIWDISGGGFTMEPIRKALNEMDVAAPVPGAEITKMDNLTRTWEDAGLNQIQGKRIDIVLVYDDFEDFWLANTSIPNSVANAIARLPTNDIEILKEKLRSSLSIDDAGRVSYRAFANAVRGVVN